MKIPIAGDLYAKMSVLLILDFDNLLSRLL